MTRLILLDRDGVVNFDSPAFIKSPDEWHPIPGALAAVARLKRAGCKVAICSNQSGVGRGLLSLRMLEAIHTRMADALATEGASFDAVLFCPHRPDEHCPCRKPLPGMLLQAMQRLGVPASHSVVIGDSLRDIEAGLAAGCRTILVRTGNGQANESAALALGADAVYDDLAAAAAAITGSPPCC